MTGKKLQRVLACLLAVLLLSQVGAFSPAVFAADASGYTLHDGTAVIPAGTSNEDVNRILAAALIEGFGQMTADEQKAILDKGFEYQCHFMKGSAPSLKSYWGTVAGGTTKKEGLGKLSVEYTCPALADNKNGDYKVRLAGTTAEVTLTKAEKLSSSITLKQGASVKLPYNEDGTLNADALRAAIFDQVVENTTPELTVSDVTIEYYATAESGSAGNIGKEWMPLEGGTKDLLTYPAISAGKQKIQISYAGNNTYFGTTSQEVTVTFADREASNIVLKPDQKVALPYTDATTVDYDTLRTAILQQVVDEGTTPSLTAENTEIKYYATATTGAAVGFGKNWAPLEGGKVDGLNYPAISAGEQQIQISFKGDDTYKADTVKTTVNFLDRAAAPFQLKQGVTEVSMVYNKDQSINYEETAQALREALLESTDPNVSINDVTVEYNAGIGAIKNYQPLNYSLTGSDFIDQLFKFGLGSQTIRFTWRGNAGYQAYTAEVTVEMTDSREASAVVLKPSISLIYNKDAAAMTQQIFEYVIDWDDSTLPDKSTLSADDFTIEYYATAKVVAGDLGGDVGLQKWVPIEGEEGISAGKLQYFYPQMGAGEQQIRVTFNGNETYRSSEAEEGSLTVKKANVSVKVHSTSIYADEVPGEGFVTTDPVDDFDIFTVYTGVSSVFVQLPERYTDNAFIKVVDPVLEKVGLRTIKDIMDKGITVGELKQNLDKIANGSEYAVVREALKLMGVDVATLQQIINVFNKITLLDNVRIALRTPDQVGIYTVYAITNNDNYNTGFGMGALVVKKHYSGVKLDWNQDFTNGKISAADVKNFDFGATLSYNGEQVEDQSSVHYLYSGFTSRWKPYSSTTTPPTEPGRYVVTVVTLGGNYQAAPITRAFQITK